jgi:hypothetical protein
MAEVRYLGMVIGEAGTDLPRDPRLGSFVAMTEPMPVGTTVELNGVMHRVTRVDEGATSGSWLWPDGAARGVVDDGPTVPTPSPERVISIEAEPTSAASSAAINAIADVPPAEQPAPAAAVEAVPEPVEPTPSGGKKKKRRGSKTVMGR